MKTLISTPIPANATNVVERMAMICMFPLIQLFPETELSRSIVSWCDCSLSGVIDWYMSRALMCISISPGPRLDLASKVMVYIPSPAFLSPFSPSSLSDSHFSEDPIGASLPIFACTTETPSGSSTPTSIICAAGLSFADTIDSSVNQTFLT